MHSPRKAVVCQLGASTIRLAVFDSSQRKPALLWVRSAEFPRTAEDSRVATLLAELLHQLAQELGGRIFDTGFVLLGPEQYVPRIQHGEHTFKENRLITNALIASVRNSPKDLLEDRLLSVSCNGYAVSRWENRMAQSVGYSAYEAEGDRVRILARIDPFTRIFRNKVPEIHTSALVVFTVLRDILDAESGFVFVDVSSDETQIIVAKAGMLQVVHSFQVGYRSLVEQIASKLGTIPEEAVLALELLEKGKLNTVEKRRTGDAWQNARLSWFTEFEEALRAVSRSLALPGVFLFGGQGAVAQLLCRELMQSGLHENAKLGGTFSVQCVGPDFFTPFYRPGSVLVKDDAELLMAGIFASRNSFS